MIIPKNIKIGGINYKIEIIEPNEPPLNKNHADGEVNLDKCIISIDKKLNPQIRGLVLLHEIIHIIEQHHDLSTNESYIQTLASGLYQILSDNKLLKE